jgi:hypothetical protein
MTARVTALNLQKLTKRLPFTKWLIARKAFGGAIYGGS